MVDVANNGPSGLSRTWPTVVLEKEQILRRKRDFVDTDKVMNDSIGRVSPSLAAKVAAHLGLQDSPPCEFQARIGSAKGMWIVDVQDSGLEDWIETYPSQEKWDCDFEDPHHRCFEVKKWPRQLKSAALNQQFIPVLEQQAEDSEAMRQTIAEHLRNGLVANLDAQKAALGHPADLRLWLRQTGGPRSMTAFHGHVPFLGGLPNAAEDAIAYLLDAGFRHDKLKLIQDLCFDLGKKWAEQLRSEMHVAIPQSAYMLMVADFWGVLEEGEVHVSFSSKFEVEGFSNTQLEDGMQILVGRAPAHLPSDIQKVRVASHPTLQKLQDVVVFSTKGVPRRQALWR